MTGRRSKRERDRERERERGGGGEKVGREKLELKHSK